MPDSDSINQSRGLIDALTIARTEEASHAALSRNIASESVDIGAGVAAFLEPGSWVNQAWNMGLHGPVSDQELDDLVEFFNRHGVESRLPVCTLADPTLLAGLARRQFVTDAFINVFALDPATIVTEDIRSADQQATDITLEIVDSTDDAQSEVFAVCTSQGFHESSPPPHPAASRGMRFAVESSATPPVANRPIELWNTRRTICRLVSCEVATSKQRVVEMLRGCCR